MSDANPQSNRRWHVWWLASRPKTLTAAIAPVMVGISVAQAEGGFALLPALAAMLVGLLIQIGTNLYNDYADFKRGADTADRLGPMRVTQAGLLSPGSVRRGAWLAFSLAGVAGIYLIIVAGWPVAILGAAAVLAGLAYTAGPWPLAYHGLGDPFAWIFFGFAAVGGTTYVQLGRVPFLAWAGGMAMGGLITALLAVNNIRDIETDRSAGRKTIPVVFGRRAGLLEYGLCLLIAYLTPLYISVVFKQSALYLLPILSLPEAIRLFRFIGTHEGRILNQALADTARLVLWFGVLMSFGIILAVK